MKHWDKADGKNARAPRFPLHVPLLYRAAGQAEWHQGESENISRSGVLFWADDRMERGTPLEMGLVLLAGSEAPRAPQVVCFGSIVRAAPLGEDRPELAARIWGYRFVGTVRDA